MSNIVIMKKPLWLENKGCRTNFWNGLKVRNKFFCQGLWEEDFIPRELKEREWKPDDNKMYECWWYYTNPADPCDPGEDILVYIEEVKKEDELDMKLRLGSEIIDMIRMMDIDHLEMVKKYIQNL